MYAGKPIPVQPYWTISYQTDTFRKHKKQTPQKNKTKNNPQQTSQAPFTRDVFPSRIQNILYTSSVFPEINVENKT